MKRFMTYGTNGHLHDPRQVAGGSLATGPLRWWQTGTIGNPRAIAAGYIQGPVEATGWACSFLVVRLFPRHRQVCVTEVSLDEIAYFEGYTWEITSEELAMREQLLEI